MRSCPGNPKNILYIYVLFDEAPQHPPTPRRQMSIPHFDNKKELNDVQSLAVKTQTQPAQSQFRQYLSCYWPDFDQTLKKA